MKKYLLFLLSAFSFVANSQVAWAAFSIDELHAATKIAVDNFRRANTGHVEHFMGYKSWKSGEDSKVKIYVNHEGMTMEFNYLCHKHDAAIECHDQ